jgi:hypothetical protein
MFIGLALIVSILPLQRSIAQSPDIFPSLSYLPIVSNGELNHPLDITSIMVDNVELIYLDDINYSRMTPLVIYTQDNLSLFDRSDSLIINGSLVYNLTYQSEYPYSEPIDWNLYSSNMAVVYSCNSRLHLCRYKLYSLGEK